MATNFLEAAGTSGFIATPFNLLSTELNALGSGLSVTSSVGGTAGVFSQTNNANGIWGEIYAVFGGAVTPTAGSSLLGWFLRSTDGGTTFETVVATASTTVAALPRPPDFVIPLSNAAYANTNIAWAAGRTWLSFPSYKVVLQNLAGGSLPATGNLIKLGPVAIQY